MTAIRRCVRDIHTSYNGKRKHSRGVVTHPNFEEKTEVLLHFIDLQDCL